MNLHEYQGKEILAGYGVRIQRGKVAQTPAEAVEVAKQLTEETGTSWYVVKAQVHAGGRGKGGGVKLAKGIDKVEEVAASIVGMQLVTPQTSAEGKKVHQVLVAEDVYYPGESETSEFYMSVLLNRSTGRNMIMYSTEGGMDIETVAEETPHLIFTEEIDPKVGLTGFVFLDGIHQVVFDAMCISKNAEGEGILWQALSSKPAVEAKNWIEV